MESDFNDINWKNAQASDLIKDVSDNNSQNRFETFFKKIKKPLKTLDYLVKLIATLIILILLLELFSFCLVEGYRYLVPTDLLDIDVLKESDWIKDYVREERSFGNQYYPYLGWRRQNNFTGTYVNVDENSIRKTENPCANNNPLKIFVFGGSTVWGSGVRDSSTVPSYLSKYLCGKDMSVEVTNFGEGGFVSTQGLIALQLELRKENYPDIVVFYDGINDLYSSFQNNEAGLHQNMWDREDDFNSRKKINLQNVISNSNSMKLIKRFSMIFNTPKLNIELKKDIEDETILIYLNNIRIIKAFEKEYGFKGFYYWQPTLATKMPMSEDEKNMIPKEEIFDKLYINVTKKIKIHSEINDISNIFNNMNKTVYFDTYHLFEEGNKIVAEKIGEDIIEYVKKDKIIKNLDIL